MRITVVSSSQERLVCALDGELGADVVELVDREIDRYIPSGPGSIELDLARLSALDSSGAGCLLALALKARSRGAHLSLRGVFGQPLELLRELHVDGDLEVHARERRITSPWGWRREGNA
jgi:ABC-type transporter Mla MlaB component